MTLRLNGSTSGYTEIDAPAVAGSNTLVLPTGNGSSGQYLQTNGSGTLSWSTSGLPAQVLTLGTSVASTSGTSIDFTGIPSTVKRITIMFDGVSTNGTSRGMIQIGTSSGVATSGYSGGAGYGATTSGNSAGFNAEVHSATSAAYLRTGAYYLTSFGSNTWAFTGNVWISSAEVMSTSAGLKALSGTLDRVRITTVNGTDTFDAGSINIIYEG